MHPLLKKWLNDEITWEPFITRDGRGSPSYGTATSLKCYIFGSRKMVRDSNGQLTVSEWTVYVADPQVASMTLEDRITLPSGSQPPIIRIFPIKNEHGNIDYWRIYL